MWTYSRPRAGVYFEIGVPSVSDAAPLRPHLHAAVQVLVLATGCRRMRLVHDEVLVRAGEMLIVPPGVVHAGLPMAGTEWSGANLYLDPHPELGDVPRVVALRRPSGRAVIEAIGIADPATAILDAVATGTVRWRGSSRATGTASLADRPSCRETYIRRFGRSVGLPPTTHARMTRLDRARRLLAAGTAPAEAAAVAGFSDQSHLGRLFREAYGTTPARYASGIQSHAHPPGAVTDVPDGAH